jgi:hypothetical protein
MTYWQIFQESFDLAKTSKFVLLYLCVSLLDAAIPEAQSEENLALSCAFLIIRLTLLVLSTILITGFTYSIFVKSQTLLIYQFEMAFLELNPTFLVSFFFP